MVSSALINTLLNDFARSEDLDPRRLIPHSNRVGNTVQTDALSTLDQLQSSDHQIILLSRGNAPPRSSTTLGGVWRETYGWKEVVVTMLRIRVRMRETSPYLDVYSLGYLVYIQTDSRASTVIDNKMRLINNNHSMQRTSKNPWLSKSMIKTSTILLFY